MKFNLLRSILLPLTLICAAPVSYSAVIFSKDYDISGFGDLKEVVFSDDVALPALTSISSVGIELSHSYVGKLVLTLRSPTGQEFLLMDHDGLRTRVGVGNGLLDGVELYTLRNPSEVALSVVNWNFTGYQPGGDYGAREWPSGTWEAGTWNLTLLNDRNASGQGAVGAVTISGVVVPEPSAPLLLSLGALLMVISHKRRK